MLGKMMISALLAEGSTATLVAQGPIDHLFKGHEIDAYAFVRDFVKAYHKLPTPETLKAHTGEELVPHSEPAAYYLDLMRLRHTELALKNAMKAAAGAAAARRTRNRRRRLGTLTECVMELAAAKHAATSSISARPTAC